MNPFVLAEFNTWKSNVNTEESGKTQTLRTNVRNTKNVHSDTGNYHSDVKSNITYTAPSSKSVAYTYHSDSGSPHRDTEGAHTDYHYDTDSHSDREAGLGGSAAGKHTDFHNDKDSHFDKSSHTDTGGTHSDRDRTGYTHSDTPAHYDFTHADSTVPHSDYYYHTDIGFDHSDYVPSTPKLYDLDGTTPMIRATTTLGFYSYDKNNSGAGSQDTRSKAVLYTVRIRQTKDINGVAKVSAWRTLLTDSSAQTYNLNTVDPLGTGNTNSKLTEGYYEIEVTAKNSAQTIRGVSQTYVAPVLVKTVKIQQNLDPSFRVTNPSTFVNFVFGLENVRNIGNEILPYSDYAARYNLNRLNGLLVNMVVVEQDKDQYLKGTAWLENSAGVKVAGSDVNIVWENGSTSIKTNGINDYTAQAFFSKDSMKSLASGNYTVVIQVKDYMDAACTNPAGATITQKTVSNVDTTKLSPTIDMTLPTVTFSSADTLWKNTLSATVTISDNYIGVDKWRFRVLTNGAVSQDWSAFRTDSSGSIPLNQSGINVIEVEAYDKVGNKLSISSPSYKFDITKPSLNFSISPSNWTYEDVTITATGSDEHSGVKRIKLPDGTYVNSSTATYTVSANGTYTFEVEDNAGNKDTFSINVTNIDDILPEDFTVRAKNAGYDYVELEVNGARDNQSGLNATPYRYSKDGGSTWSSWQASNLYKFTGLDTNKVYNFVIEVRDKASNSKAVTIDVSTLTNEIELTYNKSEGSNQVNLMIDLKDNPPNTETMITRQNMITNELVVIKNWSTTNSLQDRVPTFVVGYRYSAYARNRDGIVGNADSVVVKDIERPEIEVRGFGNDKYIYDSVNSKLYLFGNPSGYLEIRAKTLATEKLMYEFKNSSGVGIKNDMSYGRVGEYVYSLTVPTNAVDKEVYTLLISAEYLNAETDVTEVKEITNQNITVYRVKSLSDLLDFNLTENGANMDVRYTDKSSYLNPVSAEVASTPEIQSLLSDLKVSSTGAPTTLAKGTTTTLGAGNLTISKDMSGGTYTETFKQDDIVVKTNISSFITKFDSSWKLKVYVTTKDGQFNLPEDADRFKAKGYKLEIAVAKDKLSVAGSHKSEQYADIFNNKTALINIDNLGTYAWTEPVTAMVGVKVTGVLSSYEIANLNLRDESSELLTLSAMGNVNIQYDSTYLYNRMTNKMEPHGKQVYDNVNQKWVGFLYYRSYESLNELVLINNNGIKLFNTDLTSTGEVNVANVGSILSSNNLYIATSSGLKLVGANGNIQNTSVAYPVNCIATDNYNIFVAASDGLKVLDSSLDEIQFISNTDIFGSDIPIRSMYVSNGKIYVSKDLNGNEYVVLSK